MKFIQLQSARSESEYTIYLSHIIAISRGNDPKNSIIRVTNGEPIAVEMEYKKLADLIQKTHRSNLI